MPTPILEGLHTVTPYLAGEGAAKLIDFLERAFGAVVEERHPRPDNPEKIMHSQILIGDSRIELGSARGEWQTMPAALHLFVDDVGAVDGVYQRALDAGAKPLFPPSDQSYGQRVGGVVDPEGNRWYIAAHSTP